MKTNYIKTKNREIFLFSLLFINEDKGNLMKKYMI